MNELTSSSCYSSSLHEFVSQQREWLDMELKSEKEEERTIVNGKSTTSEATASHVLTNLELADISVGLYGRTVVMLESRNTTTTTTTTTTASRKALLPSHRFTVGDEIEIHSSSSSKTRRSTVGGVICAMTETSLSIALFSKSPTQQQKGGAKQQKSQTGKDNNDNLDDDDEEEDSPVGSPPLTVIPKSSVEVHKSLVKCLADLERDGIDHPVAGRIVHAAFGTPPTKGTLSANQSSTLPVPIEPFNPNLDDSQKEAIAFALSGDRPLSLIHGPPGTGKTTTIAELIHQAVHVHKLRVLVAAPSNVAVDNVLERLVTMPNNNNEPIKRGGKKTSHNTKRTPYRAIRAVRIGHPARIKPSILAYSLESLVQNADGTEIVADVRRELQSFLRIASNPKSRYADKRAAYREIKVLRQEIRSREEKVVQELISEAQVVLATNVGAANRILDRISKKDGPMGRGGGAGFDLVVIDEAAQALEASCWIPILRGKRLVLAGDHCQLPPTIKSNIKAVQKGLGKTLFERIMEMYQEDSKGVGQVSRMLRVQYRMHQDIANWASDAMYRGELETDEEVKRRTLFQLQHVQEKAAANESEEEYTTIGKASLLLIDTAGCDMNETVNAAGSRFNEGEANIVSTHVRALLKLGLKPEEIAVISPYNGQVELLRTMLLPDFPTLEIRSVDGFQGGEREAVVLSLVRSSDRGGSNGIGFLKDNRRLNVAVTRAKRHCAVVCDSETVSQSSFIKGLISWMEERGEHRSAIEFVGYQEDHIEADFLDAEAEILRLVSGAKLDDGASETGRPQSSLKTDKESNERSTGVPQKGPANAKEVDRRKAILDKISAFAETGSNGDEMTLSTELSSFDRKVIHEFANQLGLDHRSEGTEGLNRRIIVGIKKEVHRPPTVDATKKEEADNVEEDTRPSSTGFATLNMDDDTSSESENEDTSKGQKAAESKSANQLLADLARERMQRQQASQTDQVDTKTAATGKKKKKKKGKGTKVGGPAESKASKVEEDNMDDLDDMAFLDAQIDKVQTSHGRKVEGKGKGYRSIVNGILISKPPPREEKKNTKASAALQAKLKNSQDSRKVKKKGKKK